MRRHAPVYLDEPRGLWGVALHDDVLRVSKDPELFCSSGSSRPDAPAIPSMINLDDPHHKRRRNLVNRGFTPRRVADHEPTHPRDLPRADREGRAARARATSCATSRRRCR